MDLNLLPSVSYCTNQSKTISYICSLTAVYVLEVNIVDTIHASFSFL